MLNGALPFYNRDKDKMLKSIISQPIKVKE
jgi:hypothetical protein